MPAKEIHSEWAKTLAEQLVASGDAPPAGLSDDKRLALAWALKDLAYGAWSAVPANVRKAADTLRALAKEEAATSSSTISEIRAVEAWILGITELTRGFMTEATKRLDEATRGFNKLGKRAQAAHAQVPKIMALSMLGRHTAAQEAGAETFRELLILEDFHSAAKVSLNLGNLAYRQNFFTEALSAYARAAQLFEQTGDEEWSVVCAIGTADANASLGKFDEALIGYGVAANQSEKHGLSVHGAIIRESIALVHLARGNFKVALAGLEQARRHYETLALAQHLATAEKQLADAYLDLRLLPEALMLFNDVSIRFEALQMPVEHAWALAQCGRTMAALGQSSETVAETLMRAAALFAEQDVSAGTATVLLARAELALSSDEAELANELAGEAAKMFMSADMVVGRARADLVRAHAMLVGGKIAEATTLFTTTLDQARELRVISIQVRCQIGLGLALGKRGETQAAKLAFESAIE